jgi:hypothetical protein
MIKQRIKRKVLIAFLAIVILSSLLYLLVFYANNTIIHRHLKNLLTQAISNRLLHDVQISSLKFNLRNGFIAEGITIYDNTENRLLLDIEKASFGALVLPSFKHTRIFIPSVKISGFLINAEINDGGGWNPGFNIKPLPEGKEHHSFSAIVKTVSFENGKIHFSDKRKLPVFEKNITGIKGSLGLSLPDHFSVKCNAKIDDTPFNMYSKYNMQKKELEIEIAVKDLMANNLSDYYLSADIGRVYKANITTHAKAVISASGDISLRGNIFVSNLAAKIDDIDIHGNYSINGNIDFNLNSADNISYSLNVELDSARLLHNSYPILENIDDINGNLFLNDKIWNTEGLLCLLHNSPASLNGKIESPHQEFVANIQIKSNLPLKSLVEKTDIAIGGGIADIDLNLNYKKDGSYDAAMISAIKNLVFTHKTLSMAGDFNINGRAHGNMGDLKSSEYKGAVNFKNVNASGIDGLPSISGAFGEASFTRNSLSIKELHGTALGRRIRLKGEMRHEKEYPDIDLNLKIAAMPLPDLISLMPVEIRDRFEGIELKGKCSVNVDISGSGDRLESYLYKGGIKIEGASASLGYWPHHISDLSSEISFQGNEIHWKNTRFIVSGTDYYSQGSLTDFARPGIAAHLKSDTISAVLECRLLNDNTISISRLDGRYRATTFSFKGNIDNLSSAYADMSGTAYLALQDIKFILPEEFNIPDELKLSGTIKFNIDMKGPVNRPLDWVVFMEGTSKTVYCAGLSLKNLYLDYRMKNRFVDIPIVSLDTYDGTIKINSRANLKAEDQPFIINVDINSIDLHQLIKDTEGKDQKIKGALSSKIILNGYINRQDSIHGSGWIQVSDGYLWEFPVLRGIMDILLMIPPEYVVLTDAFGNFTVKNKRVYTEDFKMLSKTASLLWVGSLGFNKTLDFNITGRFAESIIKQVSEPGKIKSAILKEAGKLIAEIRLTGTFDQPRYQIVPFPLERIFKEKIVDTLRGIFGNIAE